MFRSNKSLMTLAATGCAFLTFGTIANTADAPAPAGLDRPKRALELPTKNLLALRTAAARTALADNPKVEPGKVHWHATFADACAAAAKSGKPVLLFQMMGKLDDQFC